MDRLHIWQGNLFSRGVGPDVLSNMGFHDLKYWNEWHEIMNREEKRSVDEARKGKRK